MTGLRKAWLLFAVGLAAVAPAQDIGADALALPSTTVPAPMGDASRRIAEAHTQFALGMLAMREDSRFSERAEAHFLAALANDPGAKDPLRLLFSGWTGPDGLQAERVADKLLPLARANPQAWRLAAAVANALLQKQRDAEAVAIIEAALRDVARNPAAEGAARNEAVEFIAMAVSIYGVLERYDDGEKILGRLLRRPVFAESFTVRGAAAGFFALQADQGEDGWWLFPSRKQRFRRALDENLAAVVERWRELVREASERNQTADVRELASLFQVCKRYRRLELGEEMIGEVLLNNPRDLRTRLFYAAFLGDADRFAEAARLWRRVAAELPDEAGFQLEFARMALAANWFKEATAALDVYLLQKPGDSSALYQAGIAYYEMGKYEKALYVLAKIEDLPEARYLKAVVHRRESRYAEAMAAMDEAEALARKLEREDFLDRDFYLAFAFMSERAKDLARAAKILEQLLVEHPEDPEIANFLGYLWADSNQRLEEAEKLVRIALEQDPENAAYLDSLAWALYRQGRYPEAAVEIERALRKEGETPDAVIADHAGDIFEKTGDRHRALALWRLAAELHNEDVDHEQVRAKIAKHERPGS